MSKRTILITGGNAGIGKATAQILAQKGEQVIILCRSAARGEAAVSDICAISPRADVAYMVCDLADLADVRRFVAAFVVKYPRLDVLINNAGVITDAFTTTKDGFELQIGVNHLGHFLLTNLLVDVLKASAVGGRIVNVSSELHYKGNIDFESFTQANKPYSALEAYAQSKLANVLFTKGLAKRLGDTGITANALHPGGVRTDFANKHTSWWVSAVWSVLKMFMISPEQGAATSVFLATSDAVVQQTGGYYQNQRERRPSEWAFNAGLVEELWRVSAAHTGLSKA